MWILSKMRVWNCEFCEKWDFENVNFVKKWEFENVNFGLKYEFRNVNFVKIEILKMWILPKNEIFNSWLLWKLIFSNVNFWTNWTERSYSIWSRDQERQKDFMQHTYIWDLPLNQVNQICDFYFSGTNQCSACNRIWYIFQKRGNLWHGLRNSPRLWNKNPTLSFWWIGWSKWRHRWWISNGLWWCKKHQWSIEVFNHLSQPQSTWTLDWGPNRYCEPW